MTAPLPVQGALIACTFGVAPAALNVLPVNRVEVGGVPAAVITDSVPFVNVPAFGMCQTPSNPAVAAATAAAQGVLTPMPCAPVVTAPWVPGTPTTLIAGQPALTADSKCFCAWGGVISITFPGQPTTIVS